MKTLVDAADITTGSERGQTVFARAAAGPVGHLYESEISPGGASPMPEEMYRELTGPELRGMSGKILTHFNAIERRMRRKQAMWGGNLTVLDADSEKRGPVIRRSLAFEKALEEMPIAIEPWDILVGNCVADDQIIRCVLPSYLKTEELGEASLNISHKCPDYETLLREGISGILSRLDRSEAIAARRSADATTRSDATSRADFSEAVRTECRAVINFARRYADRAAEMAESETVAARRGELKEIEKICRRVPEYPSRTLREALQSLWFVNHIFRETMSYLSIGHIDRVLEPYFNADRESGRLTLRQAQDLVDSFCLHVNDRAQIDPKNYVVGQSEIPGAPTQCPLQYNFGFVREAGDDLADAINHWGQNILISGLRAGGSDGTNPLTYMFLNAHEKFKMTSPVLTVRLHKKSPGDFLRRVSEVLRTGGGMPFINNDDIIVAAYEKLGIPHEDACRYANSNCWETLIQGMSNQEMIRGINFLYLLELALNRGKSFVFAADKAKEKKPGSGGPSTYSAYIGPSNPVVDGIDTEAPEHFKSFGDLMRAWRLQMDFMLKYSMDFVEQEVMKNGTHGRYGSNSLLSALERDCIENMTDLSRRGARYDLWHMMGEAVSNAADAAAAIKKYVFDEKLIDLTSLVELLKHNWEGGDLLRKRFGKDAPKFGNGDGEVDSIAAEMVDYFLERVKYHAKGREKIIYSPCVGTFSWIISIGKRIGASADGRSSKETIAANLSPAPGRDISGPTAAVNSYLRIKTDSMAAGAPLDLRVNMNGLEGEAGIDRISALIKTFIEMGGNMMTLTITSAEELRRAIAEPERYRGLRVRMGGWSAYFVLLSDQSKKLHLQRAEHGIV